MAKGNPFYSDRLGYVSAANESQGRMDAINTKDLRGNHSYGKWQIYGGGTMQQYLKAMARMGGEHANIAARLGQFRVNSRAFDNAWRKEAKAHPDLLEQSQYQFIKATHYDPIVKELAPDLRNAINSNRGLQEALWQAAVLGPTAAKGLFKKGWKEGNGDINKLVDVVYRDMHKYQKTYLKEHPEHLPTLLRQHQESRDRVKKLLEDPTRNKMIVGSNPPVGIGTRVPSDSMGATSPRAQATVLPAQDPIILPDSAESTNTLQDYINLRPATSLGGDQFESIAPLSQANTPNAGITQLNALAPGAQLSEDFAPQAFSQQVPLPILLEALQRLAPQEQASLTSRIAAGVD